MLVIKNGRIQAHQALDDSDKTQQTVALKFFRLPENGLQQIQQIPFIKHIESKNELHLDWTRNRRATACQFIA